MWEVLLSPDVQSFLDKQDKQIADRLRKGLEKLKTDNPFHYLEHLGDKTHYKYRMGHYRCLIDIDFEENILKVHILDHRSVIYKRKFDS